MYIIYYTELYIFPVFYECAHELDNITFTQCRLGVYVPLSLSPSLPLSLSLSYNSVGDSAADIVRFLPAKKMSPRWSGRQERDGQENAGEEHHPNAHRQYNRLDQVQPKKGNDLLQIHCDCSSSLCFS